MLPYKIRKPIYSGASKHFLPNKPTGNRTDGDVGTTTAAAGSADGDQLEQLARDDPRLIGGNLQKAILLDLIDLRERFLERENVSTSNIVVDTVSASSSRTHHAIPSLGALFGQFKTTFKERRFGAIHTRTAPRNIDRGEYAQLIYSCCFYLLEGAVDHDQVDVQTNKFNLPKAIFAVFALYTLHETNPLPIAPLKPRQFTPRTKYGNFDEDALKEAWTVLPISREEQNLYRKCYKSPVRIDRRNYLLLLQLSDICKAIVAQCCCVDTNESSNNTRKCQCFLAQDASYIIDKMVFSENFFSYCEYHGPCGLEGLAGNPHFYKEHFAKQKKRKSKNGTSTGLPASLQLTQDKLDKMKNDDHLTTILNLSALCNVIDKHKSNLQNVTAQLQKSRQPGGDLQPKQRDVVENTLRGVINSQQAYFGMAAELNGEHAAGASRAGNISVAASVPGAEESDRNDVLPLVFPESFSSELRGNICEALADIGNEVTLIRSTVIEEMRARNTVQDSVVIDTKGEKSGQSLGDILAFFDVQQEPSGALEMNDEMDTEDEMSMATGAGKNALETLLKMAEEKIDSVQLDDDSVSSYDPKDVGDAMDDNSVATGSGMKALQNLLSQTTGGSTKQPTKRPTKPAKMKAKSPSGRQKCQKTKRVTKKLEQEDEISVATGAGKNALTSLLKLVDDNIESEDDSMSYYDSKGEGEAILDDNSVATGSGMKALQNLLSQTTGGSTKQPTKRPTKPAKMKAKSPSGRQKCQKTKRVTKKLEQEDEISVATGAGKNALSSLLKLVDDNIESEDDSMSYYDSKGEGEAILDDNSVATGTGMKALQNLLSQTTGSSPKKPCKRKKSPTKPGKSKAVPAASRRKRQKTKRDTKQALQRDTDDEVSVDASTATGLSGKDDVSVASTTAAGKDALAALLSQVQSVEQI